MLQGLLSALLLAAALVSCGGGQETTPASPQQAVESLRARALAVAAQAVAPEEAARQLMDFGEAQFPAYFPGHPATQQLSPFLYRQYPQTGTYLGVAVTGNLGYELLGVYVMGGPFGSEPQFVGPLAQFIQPVAAVELRITQQPDDRVVNVGAPVEFSIGAVGTAPLAYQWYRDGVAIAGANADRLHLQAVSAADRGLYSVQVRDPGGLTATSNLAALIVREVGGAPDVLRRQNCLACHDAERRLVGPSWAEIAQRYAGQFVQEATLVQRMQQGSRGVWGTVPMPASAISDAEALAVARWLITGEAGAAAGTAPTITGLPAIIAADAGGSLRLSASAQGTPPLAYQWRRDGVDIAGANAATLELAGLGMADHERTYTIVVRNGAGSASVSTTLRVVDPAAYPSEPISIVVPVAAGGAMDAIARALAATLSDQVRGLAVNVVNVSGSGGLPALERVLSTQANGYTLLLTDARIATAPALYPERSIDPLRDLEPLGMLAQMPYVLLGGMHMPDGGAAELAAAWRVRATPPTFAHVGTGDLSQLCALALADAVGLPIVMKAYQGTAVIGVEMIDRSVDLACLSAPTLSAQVERRQVRAYAVTGMERSIVPALLGVETLDRSGLSGFDVANGYGLYVRRGTSPVVLQRLHQALAAARTQPYFMNQLAQHGLHSAPVTLATPAGHRAQLSIDLDRWRALIDRHGLRGS
jgi:tripartite-type tricarboxylate transporter receptor subunit TctC/cytochrome c551/c552